IEIERSVDRCSIRLVEVRGRGRCEVDRGRRDAAGSTQRRTRGFNGHRRRVLVVRRYAARTRARRCAKCLGDGLPLEPVVGKIAAVGDDALHAFPQINSGLTLTGPTAPVNSRGVGFYRPVSPKPATLRSACASPRWIALCVTQTVRSRVTREWFCQNGSSHSALAPIDPAALA